MVQNDGVTQYEMTPSRSVPVFGSLLRQDEQYFVAAVHLLLGHKSRKDLDETGRIQMNHFTFSP